MEPVVNRCGDSRGLEVHSDVSHDGGLPPDVTLDETPDGSDLGKWLTGKLGLATYEAKIEVEKKMSKKNNEFVKGYACAISTIVAGHGEDTATREALGAYGIETREKARKAGVDPYDLDVIFPRKSNRRRRKE